MVTRSDMVTKSEEPGQALLLLVTVVREVNPQVPSHAPGGGVFSEEGGAAVWERKRQAAVTAHLPPRQRTCSSLGKPRWRDAEVAAGNSPGRMRPKRPGGDEGCGCLSEVAACRRGRTSLTASLREQPVYLGRCRLVGTQRLLR